MTRSTFWKYQHCTNRSAPSTTRVSAPDHHCGSATTPLPCPSFTRYRLKFDVTRRFVSSHCSREAEVVAGRLPEPMETSCKFDSDDARLLPHWPFRSWSQPVVEAEA